MTGRPALFSLQLNSPDKKRPERGGGQKRPQAAEGGHGPKRKRRKRPQAAESGHEGKGGE